MEGTGRHSEAPSEVSAQEKNRIRQLEGQWVPALTIVSHPDPEKIGARAFLTGLLTGHGVAFSRNELDFFPPRSKQGAPLEDPFLSREPMVFSLNTKGQLNLDLKKSRVECKVGGLSVVKSRTVDPKALARGVPLVLADRMIFWLHQVKLSFGLLPSFGLVGNSMAMLNVRREMQRLKDLDVTLLLRGEMGCGKEFIARKIHEHSNRAQRPFVAVRMSALEPDTAWAELFGNAEETAGHGPDRSGHFWAARGGTLYLDDISAAGLQVQKMLHNFLTTGSILPLGATVPKRIDLRLMVASPEDLKKQVAQGLLFEPLYDQISGFEIYIPSLGERMEDLGLLFRRFAEKVLKKLGDPPWLAPQDLKSPPWLTPEIMTPMLSYQWPDNIRQLYNFTTELIQTNRGKPQLGWTDSATKILGDDLHKVLQNQAYMGDKDPFAGCERRSPTTISEQELLNALKRYRWNYKAAAAGLGISRTSFYILASKSPKIKKAESIDEESIRSAWKAFNGDVDLIAEFFSVSRLALRQRLKVLGIKK